MYKVKCKICFCIECFGGGLIKFTDDLRIEYLMRKNRFMEDKE